MIALMIMAGLVAASEPKVELATATDCAIVVAIGKAEAAWGPKGPNEPFVAEGPLPSGTIYRQNCDWRALGVGAPAAFKTGQLGPRFAVNKPVYSRDGKAAEVEVVFSAWEGPGKAPFVSVRHCSLKDVRGAWSLTACKQGPIT